MNFFDQLVGDRSCNVDGSTSQNPIVSLANHVFESWSPQLGGTNDGAYERATLEVIPDLQGRGMGSRIGGGAASHSDLERLWMQQQLGGGQPSPEMIFTMQQQQQHQQQMAFLHHQRQQIQIQQQRAREAVKGCELHDEEIHSQRGLSLSAEDAAREGEREAVRVQREMERAWREVLEEGSWESEGPDVLFERSQRQGTRPWGPEHRQRWDELWLEAHNRAMQSAWSQEGEKVASRDERNHGEEVEEEKHELSLGERAASSIGQTAPPVVQLEEGDVLTTPVSHPYEFSSSAEERRVWEEEEEEDSFARGMALFEEGRVNEAVVAFESEVSRDPDNSEAWRMLGSCHAENDQDDRAIDCLRRSIEADPFNLSSLLSLGTSYVNELNSSQALSCLKAWVSHNPKFFGLEVAPDEYSDGTLMDEVTQLMTAVAQHDPHDAEVQVVLGVLNNVRQDYSAAVDCFQRALAVAPEDYTLLNKVGATMANSNRSVEAMSYYEKTLSLRPGYARGWLNLGIAHANSQQYDLAVRAYLKALSLNKSARHIWSYLRSILLYEENMVAVELSHKEDVELLARELGVDLAAPLYI